MLVNNVKLLWIILLNNVILCSSLQVLWDIIVKTGTVQWGRTGATVHLNITDSSCFTQHVSLGTNHLEGSVQALSTELTIGIPVSLFLYLDNNNAWALEDIVLTNTVTKATYTFYCGCWIKWNITVTMSTTTPTCISTSSTETTLINTTTTSTTNKVQKNAYTTSVSPCHCACSPPPDQFIFNVTNSELMKVVESLKNELKVDRAKLSSSIRKLTSARDDRTVSKAAGYAGCALLVLIGISLVIVDFPVYVQHYKMLKRNLQRR